MNIVYDYSGKSVIVTGGSKGIGKAVAQGFLAAGANVFICGRTEPAQPISVDGKIASFFPLDVRKPEASQQLIDQVLESSGRLDILINNAGGSPPAVAADASYRFSESIIRLNLIAPLLMSQQAYHAMSAAKNGGAIVNIASVSGIRPSPGTAAYGAAKAGLINLTQSLAQEWGAENIRVNAIIAGLVKTEAAQEHYNGSTGIKGIEAALPMNRMASPQDISNACMFLTAAESSYVNGASLEVFGGGEPPSYLKLAADAQLT